MEDVKELFGKVGYRYRWKFLEFVTIIVLAKLLGISEFGKSFFAVVVLFFIMSLMKLNYTGKETDKVKKFYNTLSVVAPITGIVLAGGIIFGSYLVRDPELESIIRLSAVVLLFHSFIITPLTFFNSRGQQEKVYLTYNLSQALMTLTSVFLALFGAGYKAALSGYIAFYLLSVIFLWSMFPFRLVKIIDISMLAEIFFAWKKEMAKQFLPSILTYGVLIYVAFRYGLAQFSLLFIAYTIGFFLYNNMSELFNTVIMPKFQKDSDNKEMLKYDFIRATEYYAVIIVPLSVLGIVFSKETIIYVLGHEWTAAGDLAAILIFAGLIKGIAEAMRALLMVKLKWTAVSRIQLCELGFTVLGIIFLPGIFSTGGIALSLLISAGISSFLFVIASSSILKIEYMSFSRDFFYIIFATLITSLLAGLAKEMYEIKGLLTLVLFYIVWIFLYIVLTFLFNKDLYKRFIRFIFSLNE